jgi:endonuclease/exonuclease/phosphatase family metal-dependent hydrolase
VIVAVTLILTVAFALPLIARALGGSSRVRTPLAAFAPAAALVAVAATLVALAVAWWLAMLLAIPAVFLIGWQVPPRRRPSPRRAPESGPAPAGSQTVIVRCLTLNALVGRASPAAIVSRVRELQPDVLAVQELTPELAGSLGEAGLPELLPFSSLDPRRGHTGIGLWSSRPLSQLSPVPGARNPMPRAQLDVGWPITITVVHPPAPLRGGQPRWKQDMDRLLAVLTSTTGQQIVAGDFNATRDHGAFRRLLAAEFVDCADAALHRPWPGFTWPANRSFPPVMRLDHILVSRPGAIVLETRTLGIPGTDHLAVLAVIELQPIRSDGRASARRNAWSAGHTE